MSRALCRILVGVGAVATALVAAAPATGAVNCAVVGTTLDIDIDAGSNAAFVERGTGIAANDLLVYDGFSNASPVVNCGSTPTVSNIDSISIVEDATGQGSTAAVSLVNGPLAPGLTDEGDGSSEIEITYATNADDAGTDQFNVVGGTGDENIRFAAVAAGVSGVNLNGGEAVGDTDATITGVDRAFSELGDGADTFTGNGVGVPNGVGPTPIEVVVNGDAGNDVITSGADAAGNSLNGGGDDDTLTGGLGQESIQPGFGNDSVDGGPAGGDFVSYQNLNVAITLDLRVTTQQDTVGAGLDTVSNVTSVVGANGADTITGTDGPNFLVGGQLNNDLGGDTLIGLGGPDILSGANGDDTLHGGAGDDSMIGAAGVDTLSYADAPAGVTVSLAPALTGVPQATGGAGTDTLSDDQLEAGTDHRIENITGGSFDDTLTGSDSVNRIVGGGGPDVLNLGGDDDTFDVWDGTTDTVNCGPGTDSGLADEDDRDVAGAGQDCENTDFAPQTAVDDGPPDGSSTNDATPIYELSADEASTFEFKVDGGPSGPYTSCAAACEVPLADGPHTIYLRAVDTDAAPHADLVPVVRTITVDTVAPVVTLDTAPPDTSTNTLPQFTFSSEAGATFQCRFDAGGLAPCADSTGPTGSHAPSAPLAVGPHTFEVQATDAVGNVGTATDSFIVTALPQGAPIAPLKPKKCKRKKKKGKKAGVAAKKCKKKRK